MTRLALADVAAVTAASPGLPGARTIEVFDAAGPYWPTMTLALQGSSAWVACKEQSRVVRVSTTTGKTIRSVRLSGAATTATGKVVARVPVGDGPADMVFGGGVGW